MKPPFLSERESQDHHPVRASPGHVWYVGRRRSALRICSQGTTSRGRNDPGPMSVKLCGLRSAVIREMSPSWAWEGRLCMWERHESWGDRGQTVGATLQWPTPAAVHGLHESTACEGGLCGPEHRAGPAGCRLRNWATDLLSRLPRTGPGTCCLSRI